MHKKSEVNRKFHPAGRTDMSDSKDSFKILLNARIQTRGRSDSTVISTGPSNKKAQGLTLALTVCVEFALVPVWVSPSCSDFLLWPKDMQIRDEQL